MILNNMYNNKQYSVHVLLVKEHIYILLLLKLELNLNKILKQCKCTNINEYVFKKVYVLNEFYKTDIR